MAKQRKNYYGAYIRIIPSVGTPDIGGLIVGNSSNGGNILPINPLVAPVATAATDIYDTRFIANWEEAEGAISYLLDVSVDPSFSSFVTGYNGLVVTGISQQISGLSPNTNYYYRLKSVNHDAHSTNSNTIAATTTNLALSMYAYYRLEENLTANRVSSKTGAPDLLASVSVGQNAGKSGFCADATLSDPGSSLVETTDISGNGHFHFEGSFSFSFWVKGDSWIDSGVFLGMAAWGGTDWLLEAGSLWLFYFDATGSGGNGDVVFYTFDKNLNSYQNRLLRWIGADDNDWHNIIVRYESSTFTFDFFVDGVLSGMLVLGDEFPNNTNMGGLFTVPLRLFNDDQGIFPFPMKIDELIFWDRWINNTECLEVYRAGVAGITYPI